MTELFKLVGVITVEGMQETIKGLRTIEKDVKKAIRPVVRLGKELERTGKSLTKNLSVPITLASGAVVKFGADFEKSMKTSLAIMGDVSEEMRKDMSDTARDMSKKSTFMAKEIAGAYYFLASAGLSAADSIAAIPRVTRFAEAGQFDLKLATDLLTDAQSALGLVVDDTAKSMENMERVSDVLVKANTLANASVQQFSEALTNRAGAALRVLGKDVEEGVAVLAAYADQGVKGAEAGTQFGIVLRDLQKSALENRKEFERYGVSAFDINGEMRNTSDVIHDLENALDGKSDAVKKATLAVLGFQERSVASLLTLIGTSKQIKEYEKNLRSAAGTTEEVAKKQLQNFSDQLKIVRNKLVDLAISLSTTLLPILKDQIIPIVENFIKNVEGIISVFNGLSDATKKTIIAMVAFTAVLGPPLIMFGKFLLLVNTLPASLRLVRTAMVALNATLLANPFIALATAIGILGIALWKLTEKQRRSAKLQKMMREEMSSTGEQSKELREAWESEADALSKLNKEQERRILLDRGYRDIIKDMSLSAQEKKEKFDALKESIDSYVDSNKNSYNMINRTKQAYDEESKKVEENTEKLVDNTDAVKDNSKERFNAIIRDINAYRKQQEEFENIDNEAADRAAEISDSKHEKLMNDISSFRREKEKDAEEDRKRQEAAARREEEVSQLKINAGRQAFDVFAAFNQNASIAVENNYKKQRKAIENSVRTEEDKTEAISQLDEKFDKKRTAIRKRQAFADKAAALFSIGINTAVAVTKALPNIVLSAIVGGLGLLQAAAVASRPVPQLKKGGIAKRRSGGRLVNVAEGGQDEGIIPMRTGIPKIAEAIMSNVSKIAMPSASRPSGQSILNGQSGDTIIHNHFHGNFIGNKSALRDFSNTIGKYQGNEATRLGAVG